jgi:hypothetical protein
MSMWPHAKIDASTPFPYDVWGGLVISLRIEEYCLHVATHLNRSQVSVFI